MPLFPPRSWQVLGQKDPPAWLCAYPKIARLDELRRRGVRVPAGWMTQSSKKPLQLPAQGSGPWILRSVMPSEDSQDALLTGLSRSVPDLRDQADLERAQQACQAHQQTLRTQGILPQATPHSLAWLLQVQVPAQCFAIAIYDRSNHDWHLECYAPGDDPFSGRQSPFFQGRLDQSTPAQLQPPQLLKLLTQVRSIDPRSPGLEVEAVLDPQGQWHCVQAKTLRASPSAKHQTFLDAANAQLAVKGGSLKDYPQLQLDAEHNPEPLSPAHIWLMSALNAKQPAPKDLVLCGWLYEIKNESTPSSTPAVVNLPNTLQKLAQELLPSARASLSAWQSRWASLASAQFVLAIEDALAKCQAILQERRTWIDQVRAHGPRPPERKDFSYAATLSGKADFADVLPTRWDISAPSLRHASLPPAPTTNSPVNTELPADEATQWALLDEWDDHLFALALELPRQAWLKIASATQVPSELIFFVGKEVLARVAKGELRKSELLQRCRQAQLEYQAQRELCPPALLLAGRPAPKAGASRWHGLGFGASMRAKVYKRQDLQALLADPPPPGPSLLAIPALTAPAALALHRLKIRAVVTQYGGTSSHGARMAAELGLSAIIGCDACMELPEAAPIWLDTRAGRLWQIQQSPQNPGDNAG